MQKRNEQKLEAMLADLESDRVERKESLAGDARDKDSARKAGARARQAVCAFANALPDHNLPGVLIVGARDDGAPSGIAVTDELLRNLSDMRTDGAIQPMPALTVEKRKLRGADMAVVTVQPSDYPPVRYDGRVWIRTGPRRAVANAQEERILTEKRRRKNMSYDMYPVPTATVADLAKSIFENEYLPAAFAPDVLAENNRSYEERLAACRMIISPDDTTPTLTGLLTLGKSPQDFLRGAFIQFLRLDGVKLTDEVIDAEECRGSLPRQLERAQDKMRAHNRTAYDITSGPKHRIQHDYPLPALQQILFNAVQHRVYKGTNAPVTVHWYDDRVEIISPGGPYGNVTAQNFGQPGICEYRNPTIGEALKTFGHIQSFGRGIGIARAAMEKNGNPLPEFEIGDSIVRCTLKKARS